MLCEFYPCIISLIVERYEETSQEEKKPPLLEKTTHEFKPCSLPQREQMDKGFEKNITNGHF